MKHYYIILSLIIITSSLLNFTTPIQSKVELLNYYSSECREDIYYSNLYKLQNRIIGINKTDDFHTYNIFMVANCSRTKNGEIELKNDTLNLTYHGITEYNFYKKNTNDSIKTITTEWREELADCDCAFNLSYKIKGLENKDYTITINGKILTESKHKYKVIRKTATFSITDNDTLNLIDIYGLKQGLHIYKRKDWKLNSKIEYLDDEKVSGLSNTYYDFDGFEKVETYMNNRKYSIRKYFNNGKLIKTCETDGSFDEGTNCKYETY